MITHKRRFSSRFRTQAMPYLLLLVPVLYLSVVLFWPLGKEVWMSFTDTRLMSPNDGNFIGLENYRALLTSGELPYSIWVTLAYTAATVVCSTALGVCAALLLNRPFVGQTLSRSVLLFGYAVPSVAAVLGWYWIYNERSGILNRVSEALGFGPQAWLTSSEWALISITVVTVWQVTPLVMLVVLAALQSVPEEVREASRIDGADPLNVFRNVTFPHIRPSVELVALLVMVWTIRRFELVYLLTGGGPNNRTSTIVVSLQQMAFENQSLGKAAVFGVIGLVLALLLAGVGVVLRRILGGNRHA
ncbi:carbohydrate ABC transporter permease [Pseudactinotalea sp. HY158]|uniref:carbohydrate ABC transporter permease n=1 Tax=Pseudactinotalea sp. HY158 TaxID=2654547 RepID=UPI00129CD156|nr:sugar ABC transporter permease [Pseudactinotalea sp. HY158]QGH68458.1 ABC transporter permease subunit [Pseudactinotalea sp. HY158]